MRRFLLLSLFFSAQLWGQSFLYDIAVIKEHLSREALEQHLKEPRKEGLHPVYLTSFMPGLYPRLYPDCYDKDVPYSRDYEVLLLAQKKPSLLQMRPHDPLPFYVVMVKREEKEEKNMMNTHLGPTVENDPSLIPEKYLITFKQHTMEDVIYFANERVEFRYATGMQLKEPFVFLQDPRNRELMDSTKLNWLKRADLKLHIVPGLDLKSDLQIQETLGPMDPNQAAASSDMEKMKFHTNRVNVQVGTEASLDRNITLKTGVVYEDALGSQSAGLLAGIDVKVPAGQLMIFTSYKAPIQPGANQFFGPVPGRDQGGAAGISFQTPSGLHVRGGVNGIGSDRPSVDAGVSIPIDFSPKK